jgi:acyl carrier protein
MQDVKKVVRNYILENFLMGDTGTQLEDEHSFLEHHIIDSTGFIELVTFLESTYNIQIKDEEMIPENLDSLANVGQFVESKLKKAS